MARNIIEAYIDEDGNVCYMVENDASMFNCVYVIEAKFFNFIPNTPHMGRLEIFHINFPGVLLVSFNMEHDYDEFMSDLAERVAFYIENYC